MEKEIQPNELATDLLSISAMNPLHQHVSSSRAYMYANHLGQMLTIAGSNERTIQSGIEREVAKYTFKIEMPCNGEILDVIERYTKSLGKGSIKENPETIVIYEDVETKQIGMIRLVAQSINHQYFGFKYKLKDTLMQLIKGRFIPKGTIFMDSPSVTDDGGYKYGIQANVAYMTHPATSEDGVLISRDMLPKLGFKTYESRVVEWGTSEFALNLYGDLDDLDEYKPFPDIGDVIRDDGVLMALRSNQPDELAVVEKGIDDTRNIDYTFDNTIYANGPGGKIVDIKIHHDLINNNYAERHMDGQPQKYDDARRIFYKRIIDVWKRLYKQRGEALQITPEFNRLVVEARSVDTEPGAARISKLYRQEPLDKYRVEFTIEYSIIPSIGFKITDGCGGKGVMCQIGEPDEMPIDEDGNRADIVMDPNSTISRTNVSRLFEQYYNSASRDVHKRICKTLGVIPYSKNPDISKIDNDIINDAYLYLLEYYKIISPVMFNWFKDGLIKQTKTEYLREIVSVGVSLYIPTDNQPESEVIIQQLEKHYKPTYGPVSYVGNSGKRVITKKPVRIGSVYMILLEKTGDDWSAVSSGKLQHFGVLSQITKQDKYSKPTRNQAVRGTGEAEVRILSSYVGSEFVAELMDRNNSPQTHKLLINGIMSSDTPTNIDNLINRAEHPFGGAKPMQLIAHIAQCGGFKFKYEAHNDQSKG